MKEDTLTRLPVSSFVENYLSVVEKNAGVCPPFARKLNTVMTMFNSGPYPVTPVTSQLYSSTPERITYSGHGHADIPPLCMTLGLIHVQSLLHLAVYPGLT